MSLFNTLSYFRGICVLAYYRFVCLHMCVCYRVHIYIYIYIYIYIRFVSIYVEHPFCSNEQTSVWKKMVWFVGFYGISTFVFSNLASCVSINTLLFTNHIFSCKFQHSVSHRLEMFSYIYIYIYITSSSSCRAGSTDIPDPLSPLFPIVHRLRQVFWTTSRILT